MKKIFVSTLLLTVLMFSASFAEETPSPKNNPFKKFLESTNPLASLVKKIDYTTRVGLGFDDNIFLVEDNQDKDLKYRITQVLDLKHSKDKHYLRTTYKGDYDYINDEAADELSHSASLYYSYRPVDDFSFGFGNNYYWLKNSNVSSLLGDRVLAVGYRQVNPYFQMKYELDPRTTLFSSFNYQDIDAFDRDSDDFIDNDRMIALVRAEYDLGGDNNLFGIIGYEYDAIAFQQISEKSAESDRPFVGFKKRLFDGLANLSYVAGFEQIDLDDNNDISNIDQFVSLETIFSVYTKLTLNYGHNFKHPSLRSDYTQYTSSIASLNLNHAITPKTSLLLGYSYEWQEFDESDVLSGNTQQDKNTQIQELSITIDKRLTEWLNLDVGYALTSRDSDFALEGYINNRVNVGLTARY